MPPFPTPIDSGTNSNANSSPNQNPPRRGPNLLPSLDILEPVNLTTSNTAVSPNTPGIGSIATPGITSGSRLNTLNIISDHYLHSRFDPRSAGSLVRTRNSFSRLPNSNITYNIIPFQLRNFAGDSSRNRHSFVYESEERDAIVNENMFEGFEDHLYETDMAYSEDEEDEINEAANIDDEDEDDDDDDDDDEDEDDEEEEEEDDVTDALAGTLRGRNLQDNMELSQMNLISPLDVRRLEFRSGTTPNIRSAIESNERLLLSAGRQQYTPSSTLPGLPNLPHPFYARHLHNPSGVPLQRQNAIRHPRRSNTKDTSSNKSNSTKKRSQKSYRKMLNEEGSLLHKEIGHIRKSIMEFKNYQGVSPLFTNYEEDIKKFKSMFYSTLDATQAEDILFPNLETVMDDYLNKRRKKMLWHGNVETSRNVETSNAKVGNDSSLSRNKRKLSSKPGFDCSSKKHKTAPSKEEDFHTFGPSNTNSKYNPYETLTREEKDLILSVQFSSFLKSGTTFSIDLESMQQSSDLTFSVVDYENKTIEGFFQIHGAMHEEDLMMNIILRLIHYKYFFTGFNEYTWNYPKNTILFRKLLILERLKNDSKIFDKLVFKPSSKLQVKVPIHGNIVDFKNTDLRFLSPMEASDNLILTGSLLTRNKSNRIRLQLLEWMRLQPFKQFRESYFLNYLDELHRNLATFASEKTTRLQKQEAIHMTKDFKLNIHELTKDFSFLKGGGTIPDLPAPNYKVYIGGDNRNFFLNDWERSMSHSLSEQLTDNDSTALLNIQLNYVLFNMTLDVSNFLNDHINFVLDNCETPDNSTYVNKYRKVLEKVLADEKSDTSDEGKTVTLLCSLNRKSGVLEMHNTLPYTHFKNVTSRKILNVFNSRSGRGGMDLGTSMYRSTLATDDFDDFPEAGNVADTNSLSRCIQEFGRYLNPYEHEVTTELYGKMKNHRTNNSLGGGGNPDYNFV